MRSGPGPGTRRPQRTRLHLGTSRPLTAQPHGLRPQTAASPGAHTRRRGRRAERAPLRPTPASPARAPAPVPPWQVSLHSAHVWPGATSPVTPRCPAGGGHAPARAAAPAGPGAPAGTTAVSRISSHCGLVPAQGLGHPGPRPSPACCPQGKRFTFSRLRSPPGVGQLSDSWLAPRRCGSTPDGL